MSEQVEFYPCKLDTPYNLRGSFLIQLMLKCLLRKFSLRQDIFCSKCLWCREAKCITFYDYIFPLVVNESNKFYAKEKYLFTVMLRTFSDILVAMSCSTKTKSKLLKSQGLQHMACISRWKDQFWRRHSECWSKTTFIIFPPRNFQLLVSSNK